MGLFIQQSVALAERALRGDAAPPAWQYRCAAEWFSDVVSAAPEARLLRRFVECAGGPALEVGFGSGQRLFACRQAGLDIDGVETSRGLYARCRERFEAQGHSVQRLYLQPMHEIELPRRYRAIYAGRVLGTGTSREADALGLYRLYRALEPGGSLLLDHPAPWGDPSRWTAWWGSGRRRWPPMLADAKLHGPTETQVLELTSRVIEHAPEAASLTVLAVGRLHRQGAPSVCRGFALRQRFYTPREVVALLCRAGFDASRIACVHVPSRERHLWVAPKSPESAPGLPSGPIARALLVD